MIGPTQQCNLGKVPGVLIVKQREHPQHTAESCIGSQHKTVQHHTYLAGAQLQQQWWQERTHSRLQDQPRTEINSMPAADS